MKYFHEISILWFRLTEIILYRIIDHFIFNHNYFRISIEAILYHINRNIITIENISFLIYQFHTSIINKIKRVQGLHTCIFIGGGSMFLWPIVAILIGMPLAILNFCRNGISFSIIKHLRIIPKYLLFHYERMKNMAIIALALFLLLWALMLHNVLR